MLRGGRLEGKETCMEQRYLVMARSVDILTPSSKHMMVQWGSRRAIMGGRHITKGKGEDDMVNNEYLGNIALVDIMKHIIVG